MGENGGIYMASVSNISASSSYADVYDATSSALTNKINSTNFQTATDEELMEVAKEFESYLVEQVMKSMQKMTSISGDEDGESASATLFNSLAGITGEETDSAMSTLSDYYGDELISQLASTLTTNMYNNNSSGLGIAQALYEQMKRNYSTVEEVNQVQKVGITDDSTI